MTTDFNPIDAHTTFGEGALPQIYSRRLVRGCSIFFSSIFGGVLMYINLKAIDKRKEANYILLVSIIYTIVASYFVNGVIKTGTSGGYFVNIAGALILSEYLHKKYFPFEEQYEKKKAWKPVTIGVLIVGVVVASLIYSNRN